MVDVSIHFLVTVCRPNGQTLFFRVAFICGTRSSMLYLYYFWFRKMVLFSRCRKHCSSYSIILRPIVSRACFFFFATGKQTIHKDCDDLRAMSYRSTCFHSRCNYSIFLSTSPFQLISNRTYNLRFIQWMFVHVMAPCLQSWHVTFVTPHNADITSQLSHRSAFTAKPDICPFIDAIVLVKPLIGECFFVPFSI